MASRNSGVVLFSTKGRYSRVTKTEKKAGRRLKTTAIILVLLAALYCVTMFTDIPFIKKWRDIYIETAMDTMNHKWLATFFIPKPVIDAVMANRDTIVEEQQELSSTWATAAPATPAATQDDAKKAFLLRFHELEPDSFTDYLQKNPDVLKNGYGKLLINQSGLTESGTSIKTIYGDQVLAVDTENGILIVKVVGEGYVGKMAIVHDASKVRVGVSSALGSDGETVQQIATDYHSILAINASGFADYEGMGSGGTVIGLLIAGGNKRNAAISNGYMNIGFSLDNLLYIGMSTNQVKYRDAVQFSPAIIINGKNVTDGSTGFGIQPRTAIGQTSDGSVLLMTVDGRQVGYSLGCTVGDCATFMLKYGAVQGSNLDGGSSTIMVYRDAIITKPANKIDHGRYVPDAFIVDYTVQPSSAKK